MSAKYVSLADMSDVGLTFTMRFYNGSHSNVREKCDVSPWPFAYTVNRYFIKRINKTNLYDCLSLSFSELWVSGIIMTSNFPIKSMSFSRGSRSAMQRRCSYTLKICAPYYNTKGTEILWWRHDMKTLSALEAICPRKGPITQSFNIYCDVSLNKPLNKQFIYQ